MAPFAADPQRLPTVTLRRLAPSDIDGLEALYRSLPPSERYQRFFTEAPRRGTLEGYAGILTSRGFGVVAVSDDGTVVGEAGYAPLAGGDGEFGITVAPDCRGLGHVLLDAVVDHAAAAGVPALQADVLADNLAMLRLAAKRGYARLDTGDHRILRILIGTATPVPPWPAGTPHPRLLVESPGCSWRGAIEAHIAGLQLIYCPGPSSLRPGHCPALHGRPCPLVEGADAVVVALRADDPSRGALTPIHRFCHAHIPVLLQEGPGEGRPAWLPDDMSTLPADASPTEIIRTVRDTLLAL